MHDPIFRKVALERQASPEQLDQLMQVTTPKGWLALIGFGSLLALALLWSLFATVQVTVPGRGILQARQDVPGQLESVLYVSLEDAARLRPGLQVKLSPSTVRKDEGLLLGAVSSVASMPSSQKAMQSVLGSDAYAQSLASAGAVAEVRVSLLPDPQTPGGYRWTSLNGPSAALQGGTFCAGTIVVSEQSPLNLLLLRR